MKLDTTKHKDLVCLLFPGLLLYVCIRLHCLMRIIIRPQAISNVVDLNKWSIICICIGCVNANACVSSPFLSPTWGWERGEGWGGEYSPIIWPRQNRVYNV